MCNLTHLIITHLLLVISFRAIDFKKQKTVVHMLPNVDTSITPFETVSTSKVYPAKFYSLSFYCSKNIELVGSMLNNLINIRLKEKY